MLIQARTRRSTPRDQARSWVKNTTGRPSKSRYFSLICSWRWSQVIEAQGAADGQGLRPLHPGRPEDPIGGFRGRVRKGDGQVRAAAFLLEGVIDRRAADGFQELLEEMRIVGLIEPHFLLRPEKAAPVVGGHAHAAQVALPAGLDLGIADEFPQELEEVKDPDLAVVLLEARLFFLGQRVDLDVVLQVGVDAPVLERVVLDGLVGPLQDPVAEGAGRDQDLAAFIPDVPEDADGSRQPDDLLLGERVFGPAA